MTGKNSVLEAIGGILGMTLVTAWFFGPPYVIAALITWADSGGNNFTPLDGDAAIFVVLWFLPAMGVLFVLTHPDGDEQEGTI